MNAIEQIKQDITISMWQMTGMQAIADARGMVLRYGTNDAGAHTAMLDMPSGMRYTCTHDTVDALIAYVGAIVMEHAGDEAG
jgi:uncharacterized protein with PIN domain